MMINVMMMMINMMMMMFMMMMVIALTMAVIMMHFLVVIVMTMFMTVMTMMIFALLVYLDSDNNDHDCDDCHCLIVRVPSSNSFLWPGHFRDTMI